ASAGVTFVVCYPLATGVTPAQAGAQTRASKGHVSRDSPSVTACTGPRMWRGRASAVPSLRGDLGPRLRGGDVRDMLSARNRRHPRAGGGPDTGQQGARVEGLT